MAGKTATNPNEFILPDLGEGVHEAELIKWRVEVGQTVEEHDILAEMETDKALVEVPSPRPGKIKALHGEPGEILKVGNVLVEYDGGGDGPTQQAVRTIAEPEEEHADAALDGDREDAGTVVGQVGGASFNAAPGKVLATPAVRRLARDMGVDIATCQGTGIGGRVTRKDVEATASGAAPSKPAQPAQQQAPQASSRPAPQASQPAPQQPAQDVRRPLPGAQTPQQAPQFQQPYAPQPHYQNQPQQPQYAPQYQQPYPPMGMPYPMPYMPYPMPPMYPMPGMMPPPYAGQPGQAGQMGQQGVPYAPGYAPTMGSRPIPDPAQANQIQAGQSEAKIPFRGVRRTIADRLRQSVNTAVHFTVCDEADVTELDALRRNLAAQAGEKLSFLPFVCAAVTRVLAGRFGAMNATVDDQAGEIVQHGSVHLGIATDTDSGLMVPVIAYADGLDVIAMSREISMIATSARNRSIPRERLMGSTFTISNVGSHAGKWATPVINYPEVAILAVGKVYDAVLVRDGQAMVGKSMPLSLACDHRVVDGATAALALAEIVQLLQNPEELIGPARG